MNQKTQKIDISKLRTFQELKEEWLLDPEFRKEYLALQPEYQLACQIIDARLKQKMSQQELAKKMDTGQAVISRLEGMNAKPSFSLVKKIASALNTDFTIVIPAT